MWLAALFMVFDATLRCFVLSGACREMRLVNMFIQAVLGLLGLSYLKMTVSFWELSSHLKTLCYSESES